MAALLILSWLSVELKKDEILVPNLVLLLGIDHMLTLTVVITDVAEVLPLLTQRNSFFRLAFLRADQVECRHLSQKKLSLALHDMVVPADGRPDGSAADEGTTAADGGTNSTRAVKLTGATDNEVSVTAFVQFSVTSYSYLLRAVLR